MNIEEFRKAFEDRDVQIHVHNIEEWDACIDALVDLGYRYSWDRDYWRDRECYYIVNHGAPEPNRIGLNDSHKSRWGQVLAYRDFLAVIDGHEEIPLIAADAADILSLLGM